LEDLKSHGIGGGFGAHLRAPQRSWRVFVQLRI
jgi:hypothetical protein